MLGMAGWWGPACHVGIVAGWWWQGLACCAGSAPQRGLCAMGRRCGRQALRAMLGWCHNGAFMWRVSVMAGLVCHVGVASRRVGIVVVLHAMMAWCWGKSCML